MATKNVVMIFDSFNQIETIWNNQRSGIIDEQLAGDFEAGKGDIEEEHW